MNMLSLHGALLWRLPDWHITVSCATKPSPTYRQFAAGLPDSPSRQRRTPSSAYGKSRFLAVHFAEQVL